MGVVSPINSGGFLICIKKELCIDLARMEASVQVKLPCSELVVLLLPTLFEGR